MNNSFHTSLLSQAEQQKLIDKLEIFKIQGKDKLGHPVLLIIGKSFPGKVVSVEAVKKYLEENIYPRLNERRFCVVYVHTGVNRSENFPGISGLKSIYDAIPSNVKHNLDAVYFLHPGLQARLFLATFGRLIFTGGLYSKVKYVTRLEFMWEKVKRKEIEIPEFVYDYDEDLEYRPVMIMDYGLESDHPRVAYDAPTQLDYPVSMYSMRCIA